MTILCATDFSDLSREALQAAAAIAARLIESVALVHVLPKHATPVEQQVSRVRLDEDAERLSDRFNVRIEPYAIAGDPAAAIAAFARDRAAGLVLVASQGASKPDRWLRGSVAEDIAARSPVPVLVVRDSLGILQWTLGERALGVMVGVGLDESSKAALAWAASLRKIGPCDLLITQIAWPVARGGGGVELDRIGAEQSEVMLRNLHEWAGDVAGLGTTSFDVRPGWGRIDAHLTQRANASGVDLLVTGSHQRAGLAQAWHGSTASGAIRYGSCNVACVPAVSVAAGEPDTHGGQPHGVGSVNAR
jgi:nucleotide-binding universal stress UspA family protein